MKKVLAICLAIGLLLAINSAAQADQIWDRPEYRPSSNLTLGVWGTGYNGVPGYQIAQDFQINLLYQPGVLNTAVNAINDYFLVTPTPTGLNFADNECYYFRFDVAGSLPTYTYPDITQPGSGNAEIQWTLTGWNQTILAGDIVTNGENHYFRVLPVGTYRPYPNEPPVNNVEVFSGQMACEVLGYNFNGSLDTLGAGKTLDVNPVPLPGTLVLLGSGLAGLVFWRRRRAATVKS